MIQEAEFGTYAWMLTHAVAIETDKTSGIHAKHGASIRTDVYLMILCRAFLTPSLPNTQPEPAD